MRLLLGVGIGLRMIQLITLMRLDEADAFVEHMSSFVIWVGVTFLLLLAFSPPVATQAVHLRPLLTTAIAFVLLVPALNLLGDPRGLYHTGIAPWLRASSRHIKVERYLALDTLTDMAVLGTSRAFNMLPSQIEAATGLSAFNFTVENGRIEDYLIQSRFMMDRNGLPPVLFIEISPSLDTDLARTAERSPLVLADYLPEEYRAYARRIRFTEVFNPLQAYESLYVFRVYLFSRELLDEREVDAAGGYEFRERADLDATIAEDITRWDIDECTRPEAEGRTFLIQLLDLAAAQGTSLVLYLSPYHPDFYAARMETNAQYQRCYRAFLDLMADLQSIYPNLHFLDYSRLESFSGLPDNTGFYDFHHIRTANARLLIIAAAPTLLEAYDYAMSLRENP